MIPIEEQVSRYESVADDARDLLIAFIHANWPVIKRTQIRRMAGVGMDDYGDQSWHKTPEELGLEAIYELADASFYLAPVIERIGFVGAMRLLASVDLTTENHER